MELRIFNWRCIADEKIELSKKINIFFGKNSTGKSSVAYAIYMLGRLHERDPESLVSSLFGEKLQSLVRIENGDRKYPLELSLKSDDKESSIILGSEGLKVEKKDQIWSETHMAVAGRYGLLLTYSSISDFLGSVMKGEVSKEEKEVTIGFLSAFSHFIDIFLKSPLLAPLPIFIEEILKACGVKVKPEKKELFGIGSFEFMPLVFVSSTLLKYYDMINKNLELTVKEAPSGLVDSAILNLIVSRAEKNSLIVIEEPEEHKNPVMQIELMKNLIKAVKEKDLTLVFTTHSEMIIHSVLKEIEEGNVNPDDVKLHYFIRSEQKPWTEIKEINVHEDGSLEEPLEDFIEATVKVF